MTDDREVFIDASPANTKVVEVDGCVVAGIIFGITKCSPADATAAANEILEYLADAHAAAKSVA